MELWPALFASAAYLCVALALVWAAKNFLRIETGAVLGSLFFLPLLLYLVFSNWRGQFEFKGPGVEWKFTKAGAAQVETDVIGQRSTKAGNGTAGGILDTGEILGGDAPGANLGKIAFWAESIHVLAIRASQWSNLPLSEQLARGRSVATAIYHSLLAGSFKTVVVLDDDRRPLGVFENTFFLDLLRIPIDVIQVPTEYASLVPTEEQVMALLQQTELWTILQHPEARAEREGNKAWISRRATRLEALTKMIHDRVEVLVVTDDTGRYFGIVTREELLGRLLLDSAGAR